MRGEKIRVFKYKAKKGYRKRAGPPLGADQARGDRGQDADPQAGHEGDRGRRKKPAAAKKEPAKKPAAEEAGGEEAAAKKPAAKKPAAKKPAAKKPKRRARDGA